MSKWPLLALVLLAPGVAQAQAIKPGAVIITSAYRIFNGSPGWIGLGPGAPNPWGQSYPTVRLDVTGDTNTRIRIDGSNTSGIFFTLGGQDGPTIRATAQGLEVWANDGTGPVLRVEGATIHILGNLKVDGTINDTTSVPATVSGDLHVTGNLQVDGNANVTGNIGAKLQ